MAIKLCKYAPSTYYNMALTKCKLEQYEDAIKDFTTAITQNPKYTSAYYKRGLTYLKLDSKQFAKSDFKKALELAPTNQEIKDAITNLDKELNELYDTKVPDWVLNED